MNVILKNTEYFLRKQLFYCNKSFKYGQIIKGNIYGCDISTSRSKAGLYEPIDYFSDRHIGPREKDQRDMLKFLGFKV